jgi:hypothetical protein
MAAATVSHVMSVTVPMSALDLNHTIMCAKRRNPQPGGSGCGHCQQQRAANQCDTSHAVFLPSHDCDIGYNFPIFDLFPPR